VSLIALTIFRSRFQTSLNQAPQLIPLKQIPATLATVSVIIPAYNESLNIRDCVEAVLQSQLPPSTQLQVLIADDQSTDNTREIAQKLATEDSRVKVIAVPPRPQDVVWRGKNWACANAVTHATGNYFLFIDADVRLHPLALATTLQEVQTRNTDLLSCAPQIVCGCLAEWLVQPIMMTLLAVGFDFAGVNDPQSETAFAAGMFMLFRRDTYTKIGGHGRVADDLVEDVALARQIKAQGFRLYYTIALELVQVRMYQSFGALWEGWTKNYYMGSQRNLGSTLYSALVVTLVFVMPWLSSVLFLLFLGLANLSPLVWIMGILAVLGIGLQYRFRLDLAQRFNQPPRYWWLSWLGGIIVAAIAIVSIIKTETGWGWTWRGRSLAVKLSQ
jgi:cellulose synthase/poly-beta-1,6-N-acetylglucosamine synthase-like glycosyltransferase